MTENRTPRSDWSGADACTCAAVFAVSFKGYLLYVFGVELLLHIVWSLVWDRRRKFATLRRRRRRANAFTGCKNLVSVAFMPIFSPSTHSFPVVHIRRQLMSLCDITLGSIGDVLRCRMLTQDQRASDWAHFATFFFSELAMLLAPAVVTKPAADDPLAPHPLATGFCFDFGSVDTFDSQVLDTEDCKNGFPGFIVGIIALCLALQLVFFLAVDCCGQRKATRAARIVRSSRRLANDKSSGNDNSTGIDVGSEAADSTRSAEPVKVAASSREVKAAC